MTNVKKLVLGTFVTVLSVHPALAQDAPPSARPFQTIFGGSNTDPRLRQIFDATLSVGGAFDDNNDRTGQTTPLSPFERNGYYTALAGALGYGRRGQQVQFGANVGAQGRYYSDDREFLSVNRYGGVGVSALFARKTAVTVNQTVGYSPAYFTGMFPILSDAVPGAVNVPSADYAVSDLNVFTYETTAGVAHGLTPNASLVMNAAFQQTDFSQGSGYRDLRTYSIGGGFRQRITRNAQLKLGYTYREGQYGLLGAASEATLHDLDVGVDYSRPLSLSRRTRLDFQTGSSIVNRPIEGASGEAGSDERLQYFFVGSVGVNHETGRTWRTRVAFNRSVGLVQGLPEPLFSNGVSTSIIGFASRRVELAIFGAYSKGDVGKLLNDTGKVEAYSGSARMQYGITRMLAASGEYFYYRYDIGSGVTLPAGVALFRERQGVRGGLTVWLPFVRN
jgi:hypothetical protein